MKKLNGEEKRKLVAVNLNRIKPQEKTRCSQMGTVSFLWSPPVAEPTGAIATELPASKNSWHSASIPTFHSASVVVN